MSPQTDKGPGPDAGRTQTTLRQALAYQRSGHLAEALRLYNEVLAVDPANAQALNFAGAAQLQIGNLAQGVELLRRATAADPHYAEAHRNLGIALREGGRLEEALAAHQRVLQILPDYAEGYNDIGIVLRKMGRLDKAAAAYARALDIEPDYVDAHANLANVLVAQDRLDEAVGHYERAIALNPAMPSVHQQLGIALQTRGDVERAIATYERALALKPDYFLALTHLGSAYVEKGDPRRGAECFRRALALDPHAADTHVSLGIALHDLGDVAGALKCYDASLAIEPGNTYALAYKTIALYELGELGQARYLIDFERLIRAVHVQTPEGYASVGQFNQALADYAINHPTMARKSYRHTGQTGEILQNPEGPVVALERIIRTAVEDYARLLPADAAHPFVAKRPRAFRLQGWANVYDRGAEAHVHPSGWISGTYYVKLPSVVADPSEGRAGWIEFGRPDLHFHRAQDCDVKALQPTEGLLLLFPSYFWHRIIPFEDAEKRTSYAFDVVPRS